MYYVSMTMNAQEKGLVGETERKKIIVLCNHN